jgi:hypothetical protein
MWVQGWIATNESLSLLPLLPPGSGERGIGLSLRGGSGPDDPPARRKADALDTIRYYGQLRTVIYTDGSAEDGVRRGGSSAVVISSDPGNPNFLDVRHQYGPEYTTSLEVDMWGLWLALDCLDDEAVAGGVLICSDSLWALKESGHSSTFRPVPFAGLFKGPPGPCLLSMGPRSLRPSRQRTNECHT